MSAFERISKREKRGMAVAGGVVLLLLVLVAVLVTNLLRPAPAEPAVVVPEERAGNAEVEETEISAESEPSQIRFDEKGMVEYPTTTDPLEAGIAAGAAMLSVDTAKVPFRDDFVSLVAAAVTTPYEGYVNMDGQLQNGPLIALSDESPAYLTAVESIKNVAKAADVGLWPLADTEIYERSLAPYETVWRATPIEAFLDTEVLDAYPNTDPEITSLEHPTRDYTVKKEGASIHHVFVRYEVEESAPRQAELGIKPTKFRQGMSLLVYCAPPEEDGVCAAFGLGFTPEEWESAWQ